MTTFVLVHGHWHGGWAFDPVRSVLESRGHRTLAPDLPSDQLESGAEANAQAVRNAMADIEGGIVLVGHSAGGLTIPLLASDSRVEQLVFLAAVLPMPGVSLSDQFAREPDMAVAGFSWVMRDDGLLGLSEDVALRCFFHDCPPDEARAAVAQLRPQTDRTLVEPSPLRIWPTTACGVIACRQDRVIGPAWQVRAARVRLGIKPLVLDCGHSAALARPMDLADALEHLHPER